MGFWFLASISKIVKQVLPPKPQLAAYVISLASDSPQPHRGRNSTIIRICTALNAISGEAKAFNLSLTLGGVLLI